YIASMLRAFGRLQVVKKSLERVWAPVALPVVTLGRTKKKGRRGYRDSPLSTGHDGERPRVSLSELLRPDCPRLRLRCFRRRREAQGRAGTISSASPSSTTVSPTVHTVENTARRFAGFSSVIVTLATTVSPIFTGALNFRLWLR